MSGNDDDRFLYQVIDVLVRAMGSRDTYLTNHQNMVSKIARRLAQEMQLSTHEIEGVRVAGQLHDIGKIAIPSELLTKVARLHREEFNLIKTHVTRGTEILSDIDFPWPIATIVEQHHERLDGSGYPNGIGGDDICLSARIIAVADVVNAVTKTRPYRKAMGTKAMLSIFQYDEGAAFDLDIVTVLNRLIESRDAYLMKCL